MVQQNGLINIIKSWYRFGLRRISVLLFCLYIFSFSRSNILCFNKIEYRNQYLSFIFRHHLEKKYLKSIWKKEKSIIFQAIKFLVMKNVVNLIIHVEVTMTTEKCPKQAGERYVYSHRLSSQCVTGLSRSLTVGRVHIYTLRNANEITIISLCSLKLDCWSDLCHCEFEISYSYVVSRALSNYCVQRER